MMFDPTKTAAHTLEQIRTGGQQIVALTMGRIAETQVALEDGRFADAARLIREALFKVDALAEAQVQLGIFADTSRIVRANEIEEGTLIIDWGTVEKVEIKTVYHSVSGPCEHVLIHIEDEDKPRQLQASTELLVAVDS